MMRLSPITMNIETSILFKQFSAKNKPLIHKLKIFIIAPNIRVLFFFKRSGIRNCILSTNFNSSFIISLRIKRRVDVNQIDLTSVLFEQMGHYLEIIAPEDFIEPIFAFVFRRFTIGFLQLRREKNCGLERSFAFSVQHWITLYRLKLIFINFDVLLSLFGVDI